MGIFDRMGRVISSNVNALLDKSEDPKKLLSLNLDEMGEQLKRGRQDVLQAVAEEKRLKKKVDDLDVEVDKWDKRAELALKANDEALARDAIKQKQRVKGERATTEKARMEQRDLALKMKDDLEKMEQKLEELKLRKGTLAARAEQARSGGGAESLGARGGTSAFGEFRRMESENRRARGAGRRDERGRGGARPGGEGRGSRGEVPRARTDDRRRQDEHRDRRRARGDQEAHSRLSHLD